MKRAVARVLIFGLAGVATAVDGPYRALFGIGAGEANALTHVSFETPSGLTSASVHVVVDRTDPRGLNFFAIDVDFDNGTWAHGGVQEVEGEDGARIRQVNWGGLVDRGGGNEDYEKQNIPKDIEKIQNPSVGQHVGPYDWRNGVEYEYRVERGEQVDLPAGTYRFQPDAEPVRIRHARRMWQWRFTVRPVSGTGRAFVSVLHNSAATLQGFTVWNESGYGSSDRAQHTSWRMPRYEVDGDEEAHIPKSWDRF